MRRVKSNNITGLIIGAGTSIIMCLVLIAAISRMVLLGKIGEGSTEGAINAAIILSAGVGSFVCIKLSNRESLIYCVVPAIIILLIMVITALSIDGPFKNVLPRIISSLAGSSAMYVISTNTGKKRKLQKKRYR